MPRDKKINKLGLLGDVCDSIRSNLGEDTKGDQDHVIEALMDKIKGFINDVDNVVQKEF